MADTHIISLFVTAFLFFSNSISFKNHFTKCKITPIFLDNSTLSVIFALYKRICLNLLTSCFYCYKVCLPAGTILHRRKYMPKNNNDYDDIFKTLKYNHKRLFISLINKAFNKSYPLNIVPTILPTDSYIENPDTDKIEERESDLLMSICGDTYLIECQSYEDGTMAISRICFSVCSE